MKPDPLLNAHLHTNNSLLPDHLHPSLNAFIASLDHQDSACKRHRQRIEECIEEKESKIDALWKEIDALNAVQATLVKTEASISAKRAQYKGTLSPLRRTPPEIIATIMDLAIRPVGGYIGPQHRRIFQDLRSVCCLWRETAFSTPYLWRYIDLSPADFPFKQHEIPDPHQEEKFTQRLLSWFSRGGLGARLMFDLTFVSVEHAAFAFQVLRRLQLNVTRSVVSLDSTVHHDGGYYGFKFLESAPSSDADRTIPLKILNVQFGLPGGHDSERIHPQESVDLTHGWPQLSAISIGCNYGRCPTSITHQTLSALWLRVTYLPPQDVEFILAGLPRLQILSISYTTSWIPEGGEILASEGAFTHLTLRAVQLTSGVPQAFLSRLTCPSLDTLVADGYEPREPIRAADLVCLQAFIKRSGVVIPLRFYGEVYEASATPAEEQR
jgi:hypothetical protein